MRILFVISRFYPFIGGFEYHAYQLAQSLVKKGHSVTVLTTDSLVKAPESETVKGVRIIRRKSFGMIPFTRIPISPGIYHLPNESFDIINVFGCIPLVSDIALLCAKRRKNAQVVYSHIFDPVGNEFISNSPIYWIYKLIAKPIIRRCSDKISTLTSDYSKNSDFIRGMHAEVIPTGVDASIFYPLSLRSKLLLRKEMGFENKKVLLFVGRLDSYKGVRYLIDSLRLIRDEDIRLIIIGEGKEKRELETRVEKEGLAERVIFAGSVKDRKLFQFYNISDIFVLPSVNKQEVFGKVLAEAMACGSPVISTDLTGVREVAKDCGMIVEPKNPEQIASAVRKMLDDPGLRRKFSRNGLKKVRELYNWDKIALKTIRLYER